MIFFSLYSFPFFEVSKVNVNGNYYYSNCVTGNASRKKRTRFEAEQLERILYALNKNEEISIRPIARVVHKVNNHEKMTSSSLFDREKKNSIERRIDENESRGNLNDESASNKESIESFSSGENGWKEGGAKEGRNKDTSEEMSDKISIKWAESEREMEISCIRLDSSPPPKLNKLNKKLYDQGWNEGRGKLAEAKEERSIRGGKGKGRKDSRGQSESLSKLENSRERVEKWREREENCEERASSERRVGQRGGNSRERVFNKSWRGESWKQRKEDKRKEEGGSFARKRNEVGEKEEMAGPSNEDNRMRRDSISSTASTVTEWMDAVDLNKYRTTYSCKLCKKTFLRATNLSSHMKRNCLKNPEAKCNKRSVNSSSHVCKTCGHCFKERKSLTHHIRNECGRISTCEFCNRIFKAAKVPYRHYGICKNKQTRKNNATPVSYVRRFGQRNNDESDCSISECSSPSLNITDEMASDTE